MSKQSQTKNVENTVVAKSKFEELLFSKENVITPEKAARREGKVSRAFDSAIAGIEEQIDDMQDEITKIETTVAKDDVKVITELLGKRLDLQGLNDLLAEAKVAKAEFFASK